MTARRWKIRQQDTGDQWHVGYDSLIFFTVAVMLNGLLLFQYFQSPDADQQLIWITMFQILTALGGFMIGVMVTRNDLDVSFPSKKRINETFVNGIIFSGVVIMLDVMLNSVLTGQTSVGLESSLSDGAFHIPLVASVVEEAFFSFGFAIILYKVFREIFRDAPMGEELAIFISSIFVATFFAMIHMYVYQTDMTLLVILAINRLAYNIVFLKYKNFSMVVIMHMFHNGMAMVL